MSIIIDSNTRGEAAAGSVFANPPHLTHNPPLILPAAGGKIVHLKEYLPAAGGAFGGVVCTVFVNFIQISDTNSENTRSINIKSCHKVIRAVNQVRTECRSHLSLRLCACIREDEYRVINFILI